MTLLKSNSHKATLVLKGVIVLLATMFLIAGYYVYDVLYGPNTFEDAEHKVFFVSRGQSFSSIADSLESAGIIRSRPHFVFAAKLYGGINRIKIGKYQFPTGISNVDLFLSLREGRHSEFIAVTIPEGLRSTRIAGILTRAIGIDSARYVELVEDERFVRSLGIGRSSMEGYLLPETYTFSWQQDEADVVRAQVEQFKQVFNDSLVLRAKDIGLSINDVVTLASIIEGEAVLGEERARISGVYHNRLRKGMRLQADPTIQYIIQDGPRRLKYSDLKTDHPYNTYTRRGLPPGPVNNPGEASIIAALYPEHHNYLYFVANGKGGHWFSSSYSEHLRHVRKLRKTKVQRAAITRSETS
jgi:UPF0755 protein